MKIIRNLLENSEKATNYSINSINRLEELIDSIKETSPAIDKLEKQRLVSSNLTKAAQELENFIYIIYVISVLNVTIYYSN